jgi:phosphate transport system substrate-binding protein
MKATLKQNNDMAVSPIVATLVLIVVAVIGAVAVGTIMGTFSSDVSKQTNAESAVSASSNEIIIAGSTTVQPASEAIAKLYMASHPGTRITVQGGGSDAGIASALMNIVDIGSASKALSTDAKYKDLNTYQIGGSAVVVIVNKDSAMGNITAKALQTAYATATSGKASFTIGADGNVTSVGAGTEYTLYQRSEGSGTEETFAEWVGDVKDDPTHNFKTAKSIDSSSAVGATGNAGVLSAVAAGSATANTLGFVDYGYATSGDKANGVNIVGISSSTTESVANVPSVTAMVPNAASSSTLKTQILNSLKGTAKFPLDTTSTGKELSRPLNYITNGEPNSVVKNFINYARSPESKATINEVGMFSIVEFA